MPKAPQIAGRHWIMVTLLGMIWGGSFLFTEIALRGVSPYWLVAYRMGIAAGLSLIIWGGSGWTLFTTQERSYLPLLMITLLNAAIPFTLISWGQQHVSSGFAGVSMAAVGLFVLPLAHVLVPGEKINAKTLCGFLIGFGGVLLLIGGRAFQSSGSELEWYGRLVCLCAAACYAVNSIFTRKLAPINSLGLVAVPLIGGALFTSSFALIYSGPPTALDRPTLSALILLAIFPTTFAAYLRDGLIRSAGPVFMSLSNYMVPVWSVIFGIILLNESLSLPLILALLLILFGTLLSQIDALKSLFSNITGRNRKIT